MSRRFGRWFLSVLAASALSLAPGVAPADATTVQLGSSLVKTDSSGADCGSACTFFNSALPGATLAAPGDGMITTWRVRSNAVTTYRLRILRPAGGGQLTAAAASGQGTTGAANVVYPFATEIPVEAGDLIALATSGIGHVPYATTGGAAGSCFGDGTAVPDLADGQTGTPQGCSGGEEYLFNADFVSTPIIKSLTPASGPAGGGNAVVVNGSNFDPVSSVTFGGVPATFTPGSPSQFTATTPPGTAGTVDVRVTNGDGTSPVLAADSYTYVGAPDTQIGKAKIKSRARKARFTFGGSGGIGGLSFSCRLDKRTFSPCHSPRKYKHLRRGKHRFQVEATDGSGQLDSSPATRKFRIRG